MHLKYPDFLFKNFNSFISIKFYFYIFFHFKDRVDRRLYTYLAKDQVKRKIAFSDPGNFKASKLTENSRDPEPNNFLMLRHQLCSSLISSGSGCRYAYDNFTFQFEILIHNIYYKEEC